MITAPTLVAVAALTFATANCASAAPPRTNPVGSPGAGDPYYPTDGNGGYDVSHYDVGIDFTPATKTLYGDTTVTARTTQKLSGFNLDLLGLTVDSVTVNGTKAFYTRSGVHELVVTPKKALAKGSAMKVRVKYHGTPQEGDKDPTGEAGWHTSITGGAFAANEPHAASSWYPLNDTVLDKATFTLRATVPKPYSVIGNGIQTSVKKSGARSTYTWVEKDPIIGYLTTVAIDKFVYLKQKRSDGTPLVSAFGPGAEGKMQIEKRLPEVLTLLERYFGKYPQSAGGGIYVPDQIGFSLETQTRPTYAAWADLDTVVHENAHQWWGDSMSVKTWRDVCMNECFASYGSWLWNQDQDGVNLDTRYSTQMAKYAGNAKFWSNPLWDMGAGNEFTNSYTRGPLFLQALRRYIGDPAFFQVLRTYVQQHKGGNTSMQDFEAYVGKVSKKNVSGFFQAWVYGKTKPADSYIWFGPFTKPTA